MLANSNNNDNDVKFGMGNTEKEVIGFGSNQGLRYREATFKQSVNRVWEAQIQVCVGGGEVWREEENCGRVEDVPKSKDAKGPGEGWEGHSF